MQPGSIPSGSTGVQILFRSYKMATVKIHSKKDIEDIVEKAVLKEQEAWNEDFANLFQRYNKLEERIKILEKRNGL